ncbi:cytochrome P450 [Mycolicibacterium pulveris]|uniref:cytochrome P450 n=1 Tax=Mycolicibacterium pulveris TaxID=36813 RepID=UPI003CE7F564
MTKVTESTACPVSYSDFDHMTTKPDGQSPYPMYRELRAESPVGRSELYGGFWVATGYQECYEIMHRPEVFSSRRITFPAFPQDAPMIPIELDPPDHALYRSLLAPAFSPRRTREQWEEPIRAVVNQLIDGFIDAGRCDAYKTLAEPIPCYMGTTLLGVPNDDAPLLLEWVSAVVDNSPDDPEAPKVAMQKQYEYFTAKLEERRADPSGDDVLSRLIRSEVDGKSLTQEELLGFCLLLLLASIDTTQKAIGSMMWHLAKDPELRHELASDYSKIPGAVEEMLRFWSPSQPSRVVVQDIEFAGQQMKAGDVVIMMVGSADRDEREFPQGETFVPDRSPNRHLTFGGHIHKCIGAHIARLEMRVLLEELLRRIPDFEIENDSKVRWCPGQVQGYVSVPIKFNVG